MWGSNEEGMLGVGAKADEIVTQPACVLGFEGVDVVKMACSYRSSAAVSGMTKRILECIPSEY